jgi:DNA polymerase
LLDRILAAMGLSRKHVYICNVVKCRPPHNRTPASEEMQVCGQFVKKQLEIIRPRHVLCLGATAAKFLLGTDKPMGRLRGKFIEVDGLRIMPTYHPAYLLRNENAKRLVWQDVQAVMNEMRESPEEK